MRKLLGAAALAAVAAALFFWRIVDARGPTQSVETRSFTAEYPASWEKVDPAQARSAPEAVFITSWTPDRRAGRWDPPRIRLTLEEAATGYATLDALVADMRSGAGASPRPLALSGGARGVAWTEDEALGVHGEWMTFYSAAVQAPDGRLFRATGDLPQDGLLSRRFRRIYARILGSVRFKPARPA